MSIRTPLGPLDEEGVRHDRPPSQVRWTELTNFVITEGRLQSRPGFEVHNRGGSVDVPAVQPAPIVHMIEVFNPGSSATGRESYTPKAENVVPNGSTSLVSGWSGSHTDVDEGTPDGAATLSSATKGAKIELDFGNLSNTYSVILGVILHVRARMQNDGAWVKLNFYYRRGGSEKLIGSRIITTREDNESDDWEDVYIPISRDLVGDQPFITSDVNSMSIAIEYDSSEAFQGEFLNAAGDGSHTEWKDAQDGGTAEYTDCRGNFVALPFDESNLPSNRWIRSNGEGTRQTFTFTPDLTYASIQNVLVSGYVRKPGGRNMLSALDLIYVDSGGTIYDLANVDILEGQPGRIVQSSSTVNPADSEVWEAADITGGEFGIRLFDGTQAAMGTFTMGIFGTKSGGTTVHIDVVNAMIMGVNHNTQGNHDRERLFSSNLWHNRYDEDVRAPTITDVTNSVPLNSTGPGWPVNGTVLYGQAYLVNGVDPTVFYPNGSNVYGELTSNNADGATALTGRVVAAFGDRLFYGWVKDNTTVTPERISYSKWRNGQTHNDRSAGDFDLLDTPGGVVSMIPLDEQLMGVLKEQGAYVIRRTGNDIFPFVRDMVDSEVSIIGSLTAKRAQLSSGPAILFLGRHPTYGLNVYAFDGNAVVPVGTPIARKLREDMNAVTAQLTAHAQLEPETNTYWLFIPEGTDTYPKQAWVMNLMTMQWTRAELPWEVFSSGVWTFPDRDWLNDDISAHSIGGEPRMVIGTGNAYLPLAGDAEIGYDEMTHPASGTGNGEDMRNPFAGGVNGQGQRWRVFVPTMTTGDLVKPQDRETVTYKIGFVYKARDPINRVVIDSSIDGGKNFGTSKAYFFGPQDDENNDVRAPVGGTYYAEFDMTPTHAAQVRYRLRFLSESYTYDGTNELDDLQIPQRIEIHDAWVTIEDGADSE